MVHQLSWARYDWTKSFDSEDFIKTFAEATAAGYQRLGGNGAYSLFNTGAASTASNSQLQEAVVNFRLASASAQFVSPNVWESAKAVNVLGGNLMVDFSRTLFQTSLALQGAQVGYQAVNASGNILTNGALQATAGNANLFGAVTADKQEAGYAFIKTLPTGGAVQGVTLWGR